MADQFADFLREDPGILGAMARGYKVELSFDLPPENKREIRVLASVIQQDGSKLTLGELFNLQTLI